jgi:hypothetical protein
MEYFYHYLMLNIIKEVTMLNTIYIYICYISTRVIGLRPKHQANQPPNPTHPALTPGQPCTRLQLPGTVS